MMRTRSRRHSYDDGKGKSYLSFFIFHQRKFASSMNMTPFSSSNNVCVSLTMKYEIHIIHVQIQTHPPICEYSRKREREREREREGEREKGGGRRLHNTMLVDN
mmetsp:Transcript_34471/g.55465  ORF Transcript_34471/g.55465 Transcript_34471/m.55465 type:complete len:104 (-) Transcript_34471:930-1241(-)